MRERSIRRIARHSGGKGFVSIDFCRSPEKQQVYSIYFTAAVVSHPCLTALASMVSDIIFVRRAFAVELAADTATHEE